MKLVTYASSANARLGLWDDQHGILDVAEAASGLLNEPLPSDMLSFIEAGPRALELARRAREAADNGKGHWLSPASHRLLAPIPRMRKNVFGVGRNYKLHIEEGARARGVEPTYPAVPEFFSKPPTAVVGPEVDIIWDPATTQQLDYEVELGIVVGKLAKNLTVENAQDAIFGYTVVNDVSAREVQRAHGQWFKGKCMDTYCPIGPCIVTADEFGPVPGHQLTTRVNGSIRQDSNTSDMLFNCEEILMWLSRGMTLEPGDIISTGTPSGVALGMTPQAWLQDGDICEIAVEGIGTLRNTIRKINRA